MGVSAQYLQDEGCDFVRRAILAQLSKEVQYFQVLHMSEATKGPSGNTFCVSIAGYDYTINVQFEDPR